MQPFGVRRIVTGHSDDGRSIIASDGPPSRIYSDLGEVGLVFFELWSTSEMPNVTEDLHSIMTTPVVDGQQIYGVCSHGQLRCIQAETGTRVWADMAATRGKRTPAKVAANPEPDTSTERWGHAFIVKQADRYFLFNEQGDLIIAKLSPKGYQELDRAHILDPTNTMARGRKVVWTHPAFANQCVIVRNDAEIVCVSLAK